VVLGRFKEDALWEVEESRLEKKEKKSRGKAARKNRAATIRTSLLGAVRNGEITEEQWRREVE
jgi:hypothetical protein